MSIMHVDFSIDIHIQYYINNILLGSVSSMKKICMLKKEFTDYQIFIFSSERPIGPLGYLPISLDNFLK